MEALSQSNDRCIHDITGSKVKYLKFRKPCALCLYFELLFSFLFVGVLESFVPLLILKCKYLQI